MNLVNYDMSIFLFALVFGQMETQMLHISQICRGELEKYQYPT